MILRNTLPNSRIVSYAYVEALQSDPFPGQRSHKRHLNQATFLKPAKPQPLEYDQLVFDVVVYPGAAAGTLVRKLLNGNTRIEAVNQGYMLPPEGGKVRINEYVVDTYEQAKELYTHFDNKRSGKRTIHDIESAVRECSNNTLDMFESHLLNRGPVASAVMYCGLQGASASDIVCEHYDAFRELDQMRLQDTGESSGLLAAYMALIAKEPNRAAARKFILAVNQLCFEPERREDRFIIEAREFHATQKQGNMATGQKNAKRIRDRTLGFFTAYRLLRMGRKVPESIANISLGDYLRDARDRAKAA